MDQKFEADLSEIVRMAEQITLDHNVGFMDVLNMMMIRHVREL